MKEKQIQALLEKIIEEDRLYESISNIEEIEELYSSSAKEDSLPLFSIDYLSRKKAIAAARNVSLSLSGLKILSTARKSVSLNRKERLYPDLILISEEERKIIIVEIKRSDQTAREALTELLAYDHEVKNLLPFLSNFEVLFCIVSTDYSTLLDHSVTGLTTWESKQILCLKITEEKPNLQLSVHLPRAWTSFGGGGLPYTAISAANITLRKKNKEPIDIEYVASYAANLIAREGDRYGSHGFVFLWQDCWNLYESEEDAYHLTIGFMNPYAFASTLQDEEIENLSKTSFGQYVLEDSYGLSRHYICSGVLEKGLKFLERHFYCNIEGSCNWNDYRSRPYQVMYQPALMHHRALPKRVELWGCLGDFSRELITHPGVERHTLSKFANGSLGCESPIFALPLIDRISGARTIDSRGCTCKSIFDLGISLASLAGLYHTGIRIEKSDSDLKNLPASISWCVIDLIPLLLDLGQQYELSDKIEPPPIVKFRLNEDFEKGRESIEGFISWIFSELIGEDHPIHKDCFSIALLMYGLLDEYYKEGMPTDVMRRTQNKVVASSVYFLEWILSQTHKEYISEDLKDRLTNTLTSNYFNEPVSFDSENVDDLLKKIQPHKHIELYPDVLMELLDTIALPIDHRIPPERLLANYKHIDWRWIRDEIFSCRERGMEMPAVTIDLAEQIGIVDISHTIYASTLTIDFEHQFVYLIPDNTMSMAVVQQWSTYIE